MPQSSDSVFSAFITASHILHYHGVVDAYGHISVRNPNDPSTFFMSRNKAPALVASVSDLVEYHVEDASPVDPNAPKGFSERCIHSELFKRFKGVNSVIHSHAPAVLPYCVSGVPLRPVLHMAGFLGTEVPVFDIASSYQSSDAQDLLVSNPRLGSALASKFTSSQNAASKLYSAAISVYNTIRDNTTIPQDHPDNTVVLMRGHGFTTCAASIEQAVFQAVYTQTNAQIQTSALTLRTAYMSASHVPARERKDEKPIDSAGVHYLTAQEASAARLMNERTADRPWELWMREVEDAGLYTNELSGKK